MPWAVAKAAKRSAWSPAARIGVARPRSGIGAMIAPSTNSAPPRA
ncbi:hypothetical protein [Nonomuraea salmonea]